MSRERPGSVAALTATTAVTPALWGTTYLTASELLPDGRPLLAATARALPVGLVFVLRSRRLPQGRWWGRALLLGLLNIGLFFPLLFLAAFRLPGGVAATAGAIQPLLAAGLAALLMGEAFGRRTALAAVAGVVGVGLLVLDPSAALDPVGVAAAIGGAVTMATGVTLTKRWSRPVDLLTFTGWQLTAGGLFLAPLTLFVEGPPPPLTGRNLAGFAWLALAGTALAYSLWFRGVQILPVAASSSLSLVAPIVATTLGWVVLDQRMGPVQLAGGLLVVAAVLTPQFHTRRHVAATPRGRHLVTSA